jgi:hypothetical protein
MRRRSPHKSNNYNEDVKKLISEFTNDSSEDSIDQKDLSFEDEVIKPIIYENIAKDRRQSLQVSENKGFFNQNFKRRMDNDK